jgi:hypothetical protein
MPARVGNATGGSHTGAFGRVIDKAAAAKIFRQLPGTTTISMVRSGWNHRSRAGTRNQRSHENRKYPSTASKQKQACIPHIDEFPQPRGKPNECCKTVSFPHCSVPVPRSGVNDDGESLDAEMRFSRRGAGQPETGSPPIGGMSEGQASCLRTRFFRQVPLDWTRPQSRTSRTRSSSPSDAASGRVASRGICPTIPPAPSQTAPPTDRRLGSFQTLAKSKTLLRGIRVPQDIGRIE